MPDDAYTSRSVASEPHEYGAGVRLLIAAVLAALALPASAHAHANLVRTVPAGGATLASAPASVDVVFDDAVRVGPGVAAVRNGGGSVLAGPARTSGRVETVPLRARLRDGVYSVRWSVISDDGHLIQGVLAFRVGPGGQVAAALGIESTDRPASVAARWAFLLGILLAGGVGIFRLAVVRSRRDGPILVGGFALALAGGVASLALQSTTATRYALALEVALGVAAAGLSLCFVWPPAAEAAALALLAVPTVSGHALDPGQPWYEIPADLVHVTAAAAWLGGLAALTVARGVAPRFSRVALVAVAAVSASGVTRAFAELGSLGDLWGTGYGRALLVKTGLLCALVLLGFANRGRLAVGRLRAELVLLAVLVAAVGFLTDSRPGKRVSVAAAAAVAPRARVPLPGRDALVLARRDGAWAVGLAVEGRGVTATVTGLDGNGVDGLAAVIGGQQAGVCGHGCYRAELVRLPTVVEVRLGATRISFRLPARIVPARSLALRATRAFRALRSLEYTERLASGAGASLTTIWDEEAPNRLAYRISGGAAAVVIGARRWDRLPGGKWQPSATQPLAFPSPPWAEISNAHLIARTARVETIAFLDRSIPAWFTIRVDRRSGRTLTTEMVATAHFMHHDYRRWNTAPAIVPPR